MRRSTCGALALALGLFSAVALSGRPSHAALVGNIFSGPTTADPAIVYWNPAGMTLLRGTQLMLFGAVSAVRLQYARSTPSAFDGTSFPESQVFVAKPSPAFGLVTDFGKKRWRAGLSAALPMLEGATWDTVTDGRPSATRYFAEAARLGKFVVTAAGAYQVHPRFSIGFGFDVWWVMLKHAVMTDFGAKINQMACASTPSACSLNSPLARENPDFDAPTNVEGNGVGVGASAGFLFTPFDWVRIGVGVHSGAGKIKIPVDLSVELPQSVLDYMRQNLPTVGLPALSEKGNVKLTVPLMVTFGVAVEPSPRWEIAYDLHWMNTAATDMMIGTVTTDNTGGLIGDQVLVKARDDSLLMGLRGVYRPLKNLQTLQVALRIEYEKNTRPSTFLSPVSVDFHRASIHAGVRWQMTSYLAMSLEYGHYLLFTRTVSVSRFSPNANPTTPEEEGLDKPSAAGRYSAQADRVGLSIHASF
jgi:long-subunit fatty acid transport protein